MLFSIKKNENQVLTNIANTPIIYKLPLIISLLDNINHNVLESGLNLGHSIIRVVWDIFHIVNDNRYGYYTRLFYSTNLDGSNYLNDNHITTALKRIVKNYYK